MQILEDLKRNRFAGIILYEGPSAIDGAPIVVIANRIATGSNNAKTGAMVQTFIMRADVNPFRALKTGQDESICGDCPQRPFKGGKCYVDVAKSVASVYGAYERGRYALCAGNTSKSAKDIVINLHGFRVGRAA
jgi:hypothetical protein